MGATKTTADAALKEDYQPAVREQINNDIPILTYVEKNTKDTDGRRAVLSLHVTRNSGIGSRAEGGTLPTAGNQGYAEERVSLKYHYGRIQLTGPLMRAADTDKGAFERALDSETKRVVNDLKRDLNRQVWGTSDRGYRRAGADHQQHGHQPEVERVGRSVPSARGWDAHRHRYGRFADRYHLGE